MPQYIKVEDQKKLFDGAKVGDIITFNPAAAYPDNDIEVSSLLKIKEEVAEHKGNFSYQITEISRFVKAENNAELWKSVYGEDTDIKDEAAFTRLLLMVFERAVEEVILTISSFRISYLL